MKTRRQKALSKQSDSDEEMQQLPVKKPSKRAGGRSKETNPPKKDEIRRSVSSGEEENEKGRLNSRRGGKEVDKPSKKRKLDEAAVAKPSPKQERRNQKKKGKSRPKSPSPNPSEESPPKPKKPLAKKESRKDSPSPEEIKKIIVKGKVPVDQHFSSAPNVHVLEYGGKVYSATLNQTNMIANNNKYYIMQVLEMDNGKGCYFYTRWGRVGVKGQISVSGVISRELAIRQYDKKFHEKHVKGQYRHLSLNYGSDHEDDDKKKEKMEQDKKDDEPARQPEKQKAKSFEQSNLSKPVKDLIDLIFDMNMMTRQMKEIGFDAKKMPLGKLSDENIKVGFGILKKLLQAIKDRNDAEINALNSDFFSYIPHDFGFQPMRFHMIDTEDKVKKKLEMLQSLADIKVATKLIGDGKSDANRYDQNYAKLNRDISHIKPTSREYEVIEEFLRNTHAETHRAYQLELKDVFKLNSDPEDKRFNKTIHNKMLLWHGSRLTNFVGILSQGLRIAPPEAPVTGYMFGKGVYFADMVSKSANYCFTNPNNPEGLLLLCEVALGQTNDKFVADYYADNLPQGKHSTKGVGRSYPPRTSYIDLDGVQVPIGKPISDTASNQSYSLLYNEYIVYNINQVKLKYLLRVNFKYRK